MIDLGCAYRKFRPVGIKKYISPEIIDDFQTRVKWGTEGAAFALPTARCFSGLQHH